MNTRPAPEPREEHVLLVKEYWTLKEQADEIKDRMDAIRGQLADAFPQGATIAGTRLTVSTPRVFDAAKAAQAYPRDKHPELWPATFDAKKARKVLDALDLLDAYQTDGTRRVSLR